RAKGRKPLEISGVGGHELAAPCMTVSAVPGSVEGDAEDRTGEAMLRHRARDVRMMMLHADRRHTAAPERIGCREIIGMQIVRDQFRLDAKKALHPRDRFLERLEGIE